MPRPRRLPNEEGLWQCTKCKEWKDRSEFHANTNARSGLSSWCKTCVKASQATWREGHQTKSYTKQAGRYLAYVSQIYSEVLQILMDNGCPVDQLPKKPWYEAEWWTGPTPWASDEETDEFYPVD